MTCIWEPDPTCLPASWNELDEADQDRFLALATSSLQMLTLYRIGTCPETIRPMMREKVCGHDWDLNQFDDGMFLMACTCKRAQWYKSVKSIDLPGPVGYISQFKINGVRQNLSSSDWRLDNGHLVVWQGEGPSPVPETQDLTKPDTEPNTWSITYSRSAPLDSSARMAVARLAAEFAEACQPKGKCSLPKGARNVSRNGVQFTIDEAVTFPGGLTGIETIDAWILQWAPADAPSQRAQVFNPRDLMAGGSRNRRTSGLPTQSATTLPPRPGVGLDGGTP